MYSIVNVLDMDVNADYGIMECQEMIFTQILLVF